MYKNKVNVQKLFAKNFLRLYRKKRYTNKLELNWIELKKAWLMMVNMVIP